VSAARRGVVTALLGVLLAASGCVTLPDGGDVRAQPGDALPADEGIRYLPPGPAPGASSTGIVTGFLDAMLASPVQTSTAREFLTERAADTWQPQQRVIVYDDVAAPAAAMPGRLVLDGAAWVDASGRWRGALPAAERRVHLSLTQEDGEWRIAGLPDALLARRSWFSREYGQFQVHFLAPDRESLVPEPVFVPRGGQLATSLVRALLAGPPAASGVVTRLRDLALVDGAVTIKDGTARIDLTGSAELPTPEARNELAAQLTWTLQQVPGLRTLQVRIDDTPLTLEGGLTEIPILHGALLDPSIAEASNGLFGLVDGRPARVTSGEGEPIGGPWSSAYRLRDVSIDLAASNAAGVRADGRAVRIAPLAVDGTTTEVSGEDFAHPAWDRAGRAWLLDRRASGAGVTAVVGGRLVAVTVPGVSGRQVIDLLVSRDGTRLVAAVRAGGRDTVVVSRVRWSGRRVAASPARRIAGAPSVRDLAWEGPDEVLVLSGDRAVSRVRWLSLDGAPDDLREAPPVDTIVADVRRLVASGTEDTPAWAVAADGSLIGIGRTREQRAARGIAMLTWVG
jgi:Lipoprotein LpqB beta-propeller domain/Sporulation and spore germination